MKLINQAKIQTHQGLIDQLNKEENDYMLYISTTRTKLINQENNRGDGQKFSTLRTKVIKEGTKQRRGKKFSTLKLNKRKRNKKKELHINLTHQGLN